MTRLLAAVVAVMTLIPVAGCGSGMVPNEGATARAADDDAAERSWCGLAITYLEDDLPQITASDSSADVADRFRQQYFGEGAAELEDSIVLAPAEIAEDVAVVVAVLRRAADLGDASGVGTGEFRGARAGIGAYNQRSCPRFSEGGPATATETMTGGLGPSA